MRVRIGRKSMKHALLQLALALSCAVNFGCSSPPPATNSFTEVYTKVLAPSCTSDFCHYNNVGIRYSALDLSSPTIAYWNLVDQPCAGPSCSEMGTRVVPFRPASSLMYLKVSESMPPCGSQMPADPVMLTVKGTSVFSGTALGQGQQQLIHDWIASGAQNN
jgi:hypothetical protein